MTDLESSLEFYCALGYERVGTVELGNGASLTMLKFPGEEVVTLELVHRPADGPVDLGTGFSHLPIQVDDLSKVAARLTAAGIRPGPVERPGGPEGPHVSWLVDPDGYRIELVQWPPGHPHGITAGDFRLGRGRKGGVPATSQTALNDSGRSLSRQPKAAGRRW